MFKKTVVCAVLFLMLNGCAKAEKPYWEQQPPQLSELTGQDKPAAEKRIFAVWIPVMQYADWMTGHTEQEFRQSVREAFADCAAMGLNTVFLHVRAYQDAYYTSSLFPHGAYLTGDYDPLAVMTDEAHAAGLAVHAWVNPLRGQTAEVLAKTDSRYPLRQWFDDAQKKGTRLVETDGRFWLNPAYAEVRQLCADGVTEILKQYDIEGIHIDDYFYPTQDTAFDAQAFAESDSSDLAAFRRENCTALVRAMHDAVKAVKPDCIFSISPQGNTNINREQLYADTARWAGEEGFCDWILPQIYYGFENETCPFAQVLAEWKTLAVSATLIPGLAAYKAGKEDKWAGSGAGEWIRDPDVLSRQIQILLDDETIGGFACYSYADCTSASVRAQLSEAIGITAPSP